MSNYSYAMAQPENTKSAYSEYDTVDFKISFAGKKLVANSLRLLANVNVQGLKEDAVLFTEYLADKNIGAHMFIDELQVSTSMSGNIETIHNYPRFIAMLNNATHSANENMNSEATCELRAPTDRIAGDYYKGVRVGANKDDVDFSISPDMCLNRVEGNPLISYSKTGDITVTLRLARNSETLYGPNFGPTNTYSLSDLRLTYLTVPDDGQVNPVVMRTKLAFNSSVDGTYVSVSSKVPAVCTAMSASFLPTSKVGSLNENTNKQEQLPGVTAVQFLFNDTENRYITYEIRDKNEVIQNYLESFATIEGNRANPAILDSNEAYGIGINFKSAIDLSTQKFTTIINSNVSNTDPYTMYLYFHGLLSL